VGAREARSQPVSAEAVTQRHAAHEAAQPAAHTNAAEPPHNQPTSREREDRIGGPGEGGTSGPAEGRLTQAEILSLRVAKYPLTPWHAVFVTADGDRYGPEFRRLRDWWPPKVAAGSVHCHAVECLQESRRIVPGTPWDLGHSQDGRYVTGPEHGVQPPRWCGAG